MWINVNKCEKCEFWLVLRDEISSSGMNLYGDGWEWRFGDVWGYDEVDDVVGRWGEVCVSIFG